MITERTARHGIRNFRDWRPISTNFTTGGNKPRLLIVHIMQGTLGGTDAWFRNPASQVSAHFGVARSGEVVQWVDCDDMAWHAVAANSHSIGVECEGFSGQPLTSVQLDVVAGIMHWAHDIYPGISGWLNSRPDVGSGLSWHGLGGAEWGNHPDCPGAPVVHQLPEILSVSSG